MKLAWTRGVFLLCSVTLSVFADSNIPTDDVIQQQFVKQSGGMMRLEGFTLRQLEKEGERTTYRIEGDVASTDNLYDMVGAVGDYIFFERTWTKGQTVKFSAIMTTVGTTASGWEMKFSAPQTAAKKMGRPFSGKEDLSTYLIVNDPGFRAQLAKIDARFSTRMAEVQKQQRKYDELKQQLVVLNEKILRVWGTKDDGQPTGRNGFHHALYQELAAVDAKNDFDEFEKQYDASVYQPALKACQKKNVCDSAFLDAARNRALKEHEKEAYRQHQRMVDKIEFKMAENEKKEASFLNAANVLRDQMEVLESSNREMSRDAEQWREGVERLRKEGMIP